MPSTRRVFIKELGIALASLAMTRCAPWIQGVQGTDSKGEAIKTAEPVRPEQRASIASERLRGIWQQFDELAAATNKDAEQGTQLQESLVADHRAALDDLVDLGELPEAVAGRVQVAFEAAAGHVWRANAPITCYAPVLVDYRPVSSDQLVKQAGILAGREDLDPQIRAQAQDAIAKDIAFLNLPPVQVEAMYQEIIDGQQASRQTPAFVDVELDILREDLQAAQFLVKLLLGDTP